MERGKRSELTIPSCPGGVSAPLPKGMCSLTASTEPYAPPRQDGFEGLKRESSVGVSLGTAALQSAQVGEREVGGDRVEGEKEEEEEEEEEEEDGGGGKVGERDQGEEEEVVVLFSPRTAKFLELREGSLVRIHPPW